MTSQRHRRPAYAIVRVNDFESTEPGRVGWSQRVTVVRVVWSLERAQAETERLQQVNADKKAIYFWQTTRYEPDGKPEDVP